LLSLVSAPDGTPSNSTASLAWLRDIIQRCTSSHPHCHNGSRPSGGTGGPLHLVTNPTAVPICQHTLPTRVLDVGQSPEDKIRLLETESTIDSRYICFSHCWGTKRPLVTTRDNIRSWKEAIAWHLIPKTFQDAIEYTRALKIRYLWIDSLCIIQDDIQDWQTQAGKMAEIYQNSFLVLAATASQDCESGLFPKRLPRRESHIIRGIDSSNQKYRIYVRKRTPHFCDRLCQNDIALEMNFPLMTRAWVYQERLLAPRVLHFCSNELIWYVFSRQ